MLGTVYETMPLDKKELKVLHNSDLKNDLPYNNPVFEGITKKWDDHMCKWSKSIGICVLAERKDAHLSGFPLTRKRMSLVTFINIGYLPILTQISTVNYARFLSSKVTRTTLKMMVMLQVSPFPFYSYLLSNFYYRASIPTC